MKNIRIDKLLSSLGYGSRKQIGEMIKMKVIFDEKRLIKDKTEYIDPYSIYINKVKIKYVDGVNIIINKPRF